MDHLPYQNPALSPELRADDLLARMTVGEKQAQLCGTLAWTYFERVDGKIHLSEEGKRSLSGEGVGGLYGLLRADPWTGMGFENGLTPEEGRALVKEIFAFVRDKTRHGIPPFVISEASHGHQALGSTIGPTQLTASQSFDSDLWGQLMFEVGAEVAAYGANVVFCPNADLGRDPRWGRCDETCGEDPYVASRFISQGVYGLQRWPIAAVVKHFIHGTPLRGLNARSAMIGARELQDVYLRPFRVAVRRAALGIMPAYNEVDGEPCHASRFLLQDVLREQLGFGGVTFSDVAAVGMVADIYRRAPSPQVGARLALEAGMDFETGVTNFYRSIEVGTSPALDAAARRVLILKFQLGLFEGLADVPQINRGQIRHTVRQLARKSVVLLQNRDHVLPLSPRLRQIAVIGPNADAKYNQLGDYTPPMREENVVTVLRGVQTLLPDATVTYARGGGVRSATDGEIAEAVSVAKAAEVVILVLGGSSARDFSKVDAQLPTRGDLTLESSSSEMECGEGVDRMTLGLLGRQLELAEAVVATGKPVVAVLMGGRPMIIESLRERIPGILWAGYPGQEGGTAIAELLFGLQNPSGRVTMTWPRNEGQLPVFSGQAPHFPNHYLEGESTPAFPFGFGLSYSEFRYSSLQFRSHEDSVEVTLDVTNASAIDGDEVILLFLTDRVTSLTRPERELRAFERVHLRAGETREVRLWLGPEEIGTYDRNGQLRAEEGDYEVTIGLGEAAISGRFTYQAPSKP